MKSNAYAIVGSALLGAAAAGAWWWYTAPAPVAEVGALREPAPALPPAPIPAAAATAPAVRHPVAAAAAAQATRSPPTVEAALIDLFGPAAVRAALRMDDFPRRFVATVDNLGGPAASAGLWPVHPARGRFQVRVDAATGATAISPENAARYAPLVGMLEQVDLRQAVMVYRQLYPQFQQAYVELGYPHGYFNDRLVDVIDQLLATPEVTGPPTVHLPQIKGPLPPARPWVLYEFDDPKWQALSSGQRIVLRMGAADERRVKGRLAELRRLLTS